MVSMAAVGLPVGAEAATEASAACAAAQAMLSTLFPPVLALLHSSDSDVAMAGVPLLHAYVAKLKAGLKRAGNALPEVCSCYPPIIWLSRAWEMQSSCLLQPVNNSIPLIIQ